LGAAFILDRIALKLPRTILISPVSFTDAGKGLHQQEKKHRDERRHRDKPRIERILPPRDERREERPPPRDMGKDPRYGLAYRQEA